MFHIRGQITTAQFKAADVLNVLRSSKEEQTEVHLSSCKTHSYKKHHQNSIINHFDQQTRDFKSRLNNLSCPRTTGAAADEEKSDDQPVRRSGRLKTSLQRESEAQRQCERERERETQEVDGKV